MGSVNGASRPKNMGQMGSDPSVHTLGLTLYPSDPYLTPNGLSEPIKAEITVQFWVNFFGKILEPADP